MIMENIQEPNLQYVLFCNEFVENSGQVSILGVLDGADVRGTLKRGEPMPRKMFPLKLVLGINAPSGVHQVKLGITRPSGGVMTSIDLESFEMPTGVIVHRCIASLDMEVDEDGLYIFTVFLNGSVIGGAVLPMSFTVDFVD